MARQVRKILIISDTNYKPVKLYLDQMPKLTKGFIRLGHDVRHLSYCGLLSQLSPFKSRSLSSFIYKKKVDEILARFTSHYKPDIIYISFAKHLNAATLSLLREAAPAAVLIGMDGDPWPEREPGRIETAKGLDVLMATNDGIFIDQYRQAGINKCIFMPNMCDPDLDHRYEVDQKWKSNILWTGAVQHTVGLTDGDQGRQEIVHKLAQRSDAQIYGCLGRPKIEGMNYLYAISGARIGINVNAYESVRLCHSDRLTQYLACGTLVLAKRFEGCDLLYQDMKHLRYFEEPAECMDMAEWFLAHENERKKIADDGMEHCHTCFNSVRMAGYILELVQTGQYQAPWGKYS